MKKFIGFLLAVALLALAGVQSVQAQRLFVANDVIMAAGVSNATDTVTLGAKLGHGDPLALLDRVTVYNGSATNAVVTLYSVEAGVDVQIGVSGTIAAGGSETIYPTRNVTDSVAGGYAVTNYPVAYVNGGYTITTGDVSVVQSTVTNYYTLSVLVPVTETRTLKEKYLVRDLKVSIQQEIGTTAAATYKWSAIGL